MRKFEGIAIQTIHYKTEKKKKTSIKVSYGTTSYVGVTKSGGGQKQLFEG